MARSSTSRSSWAASSSAAARVTQTSKPGPTHVSVPTLCRLCALGSIHSRAKLVADSAAAEQQEQRAFLEPSPVEQVCLDLRRPRPGQHREGRPRVAERRNELLPPPRLPRDALREGDELTELVLEPLTEPVHSGGLRGRDRIGIELPPERRVLLEPAPKLLQVSIRQRRRPERHALSPTHPLHRSGTQQA